METDNNAKDLAGVIKDIQDQANDPSTPLGKSAAMLRQGIKGAWEVTVGLHPGDTQENLTKVWTYTREDLEADRQIPEHLPTKFSRISEEAHHYARTWEDPARMNSVRCTWNWF